MIKILRRTYSLSELVVMKKSLQRIMTNPRKIINFLLVKASLFLRLKKVYGLPLHVLIEPTGECIYRCIKCARFANDYEDDGLIDGSRNMSLDKFKKIIDEIGKEMLTLRLWHYGEALLHPDVLAMIKYAKGSDIFVAMSTVLPVPVTDEFAKGLILSGLDYCMITLDGVSKETYKKHHGVDNLDAVVSSAKKILNARKSAGKQTPFIEMQFVVMRDNEHEIEKARALAADIGVDKVSFQKLDANHIDVSRLLDCSSSDDLLPEDKAYRLNQTIVRSDNDCSLPWEETVIRYSGRVLVCAQDHSQKNTMGVAFKESRYLGFKDIWNGSAYRKYRKQILKNIDKNQVCRQCTKRNNSGEQTVNV